MRYQVPQFVDIEDKIVGPFTLKQFFIYLGAVLLMIPMYVFSDLSLFITLAIPILGIAVMFAHMRVHGKSLFAVIANALNFTLRGQLYLWQRVSTPKFMRIQGEEYGDFLGADDVFQAAPDGMTSLSARARQLETEGHVTKEDEADPLAPEEA